MIISRVCAYMCMYVMLQYKVKQARPSKAECRLYQYKFLLKITSFIGYNDYGIYARCILHMVHGDNVNVKANVKRIYRFCNYITWPARRKLKITRAFHIMVISRRSIHRVY